ncbi:hypothetical protein Agub_g14910, partial [Astrephomene gubernaculifera]
MEALVARMARSAVWQRVLFAGGAEVRLEEGTITVTMGTSLAVPAEDAASEGLLQDVQAALFRQPGARGELEVGGMLNGSLSGTLFSTPEGRVRRCGACGKLGGAPGTQCTACGGGDFGDVLTGYAVGLCRPRASFDMIGVQVRGDALASMGLDSTGAGSGVAVEVRGTFRIEG